MLTCVWGGHMTTFVQSTTLYGCNLVNLLPEILLPKSPRMRKCFNFQFRRCTPSISWCWFWPFCGLQARLGSKIEAKFRTFLLYVKFRWGLQGGMSESIFRDFWYCDRGLAAVWAIYVPCHCELTTSNFGRRLSSWIWLEVDFGHSAEDAWRTQVG